MALRSSYPSKKILVIFKDDSSLFSARKFADIIEARGFDVFLCHSFNRRYNGQELSERQISEGAGGRKIDFRMEMREVAKEEFLNQFDIISSCKFPTIFQLKFLLGAWDFSGKRPGFLATFPGIDFTPKLGIRARRFVDIMCVNGPLDKTYYQKYLPRYIRDNQKLIQFSPFLKKSAKTLKSAKPKKVVFFSQSIMPGTKESRSEVLQTIVEAAKKHPSVEFLFKLRHLEHENSMHTHKESYPYQTLASELYSDKLPPNFAFTSKYIGVLLKEADLSITCASTAGIEALASGVPNLFYTNYLGADRESHSGPLKELVADSGMEVGREEIMGLRVSCPQNAWLEKNLTNENMVDDVILAINQFNPDQSMLSDKWLRHCPKVIVKLVSLFL